MNTFKLVWENYGSLISRNTVNPDPRPTEVVADTYRFYGDPAYGIAFFVGHEDEAIIYINDVPLTITRVGA